MTNNKEQMTKPNAYPPLTTIILAGGKGSRMGYVQKGTIQLADRPVIEYILQAVKPLATNILISANSRSYDQYGYPVIPDEQPDKGPLGGIVAALRQSPADNNLVVACDMPNVTTSFVSWLLAQQEEEADAIVPMIHGDTQPLCALYKKSALPVLAACLAKDHVRMKEVVLHLDMAAVEIPHSASWCDKNVFANLNTPSDFVTPQYRSIYEN